MTTKSLLKKLFTLTLMGVLCLAPQAGAADTEESNQFLIELAGGGPDDLEAAVEAAGGTLVHEFNEIGAASAISDKQGFARKLKKSGGIKRVTRDLLVQWIPESESFDTQVIEDVGAEGNLTDPTTAAFFPCQWNMTQIDTPGAWAQGEFGAGATVAVVDTGISDTHLFGTHVDLAGQVAGAFTTVSADNPLCALFGAFDSTDPRDFNFHGTFVSGIVTANGFRVAGVAPDSRVIGVKVLNCLGSGTFGDVIAGILFAAGLPQVDVINMSLGAYFPKNLPGGGPLVAALNKAVNFAQGVSGKLVVSSAGNGDPVTGLGIDLDHDGNFVHVPSQSGSGVSAWAGDIDGGLASYSNHGHSGADVGAGGGDSTPGSPQIPLPGCGLPSGHDGIVSVCSPDSLFFPVCGTGNFVLFGGTGTSFSAPAVSGVAALAVGAHGSMNGGQLKTLLKNTADDLGKKGADNLFSHGRVNAKNASQ